MSTTDHHSGLPPIVLVKKWQGICKCECNRCASSTVQILFDEINVRNSENCFGICKALDNDEHLRHSHSLPTAHFNTRQSAVPRESLSHMWCRSLYCCHVRVYVKSRQKHQQKFLRKFLGFFSWFAVFVEHAGICVVVRSRVYTFARHARRKSRTVDRFVQFGPSWQ